MGVVTYPEDDFQLVAKIEDARDYTKFYEKDHVHRYAKISYSSFSALKPN